VFINFPTSKKVLVFNKVEPSKELYVEYYAPQAGRPTVVLLHGLTYTTAQWSKFIPYLTAKGYGVVCYDMEGMGKTLLKYAPIRSAIPLTGQIADLDVLLKKMKIQKPYNLLGLSYGGGVAFGYAVQHPKNVGHLILVAPFMKPLKKVEDFIQAQVAATRLMNPFNPYSDQQVEEFYFRQFVYATYPQQEPIVLENPYKLEAVFRMSYGVTTFIPENNTDKLKVPAHLIVADKDQYFPLAEYENFWSLFPENTKASFTIIKNSEHKIPEAQPAHTAQAIEKILK
jgi:pimeloyl-ACP methyl ester carboxylesterase